jgi:zinc D-Ala-D-Ala dipeptidase
MNDPAFRDRVYRHLETMFVTYAELLTVPVRDNGEPMVGIAASDTLTTFNLDPGMRPYTGDMIYVRASVLRRLQRAARALQCRQPGSRLEVVYGYRHINIQTAKYEMIKAKIQAERWGLSGLALNEAIHCFVAVPEVAGHPTGGAVDVRLVNRTGKYVNMGTEAHDFVEDSYVHSLFIPKEAWQNRQLLRQVMTGAGFAPYDGEWLHFSWGDREWARYYKRPRAIYSQIPFSRQQPDQGR